LAQGSKAQGGTLEHWACGLRAQMELDGNWRSSQLISRARHCAERAERFRVEERRPLAEAQLLQCVAFLEQALLVDPDDLSTRCWLVGCYMRLGNFLSAKEQALFALRKISDEGSLLEDPLLHLAITQLSTRLGQHEDAVAFAQRATEEYPLHPQPCATLSRALSRVGRCFAGKKTAEMALSRDDDPRCTSRLSPTSRQAASELEAADLSFVGALCVESTGDATTALCGEGAVAARYGRTGAADADPQAVSAEGPRPLGVHGRDLAEHGATGSHGGLRARFTQMSTEDRHLGVHEILVDSHPVRATCSRHSDVIGAVGVGTRVRVSGVVVNSEEDETVWGRIHSPVTGWVAILDPTASRRWTNQVATVLPAQGPPDVRRVPFGPVLDQGPGSTGSWPSVASGDLDRIFSGLMPATSSPLAMPKDANRSSEPMMPAERCSNCKRCYACWDEGG